MVYALYPFRLPGFCKSPWAPLPQRRWLWQETSLWAWWVPWGLLLFSLFFKRFYLFIFRKRGGAGEREGERHQCVLASCAPPTGDLARNPDMCPDWESSQRSFGLQAGAQSTKPYKQGLLFFPEEQIVWRKTGWEKYFPSEKSNKWTVWEAHQWRKKT